MSEPRDGLVIVDKPAGWTSHDVVAKLRGLAGTRRVGHAGTLDPMATGVLVAGVQRATRLLGHLALTEKVYEATVRLGQSTNTDDAEGEITATAPSVETVTDQALRAAIDALTGEIRQVPPQVSAIKVGGRRAYKSARRGEEVELAARPVTVKEFHVRDVRRAAGHVAVDASITCSSGTYIRALARDLGGALGVGGHLTALRRTRVGPYDLATARTIDRLAESFEIMPIAEAAAAAFPRHEVSGDQARAVSHGGRLPATGRGPGPVAVFAQDGTFLALVEDRGEVAKPLAVFTP